MAELLKEYHTLQLIEGCSDSWPGHAFVAHWQRAEPWRALTLPQRERLLCLAVSSSHAASLDAALAQCGCALKPEVLTAAAAAGNLAGCERLLREGCSFSTDALAAAARGAHLPALQLLLTAIAPGGKASDNYLVAAAQGSCAGGQLAVLAWLQQAHGYSPRLPDAEAAARAGQVAALEQLLPLLLPELGASEDQAEPPTRAARHYLLIAIVEGCPVAVLQRHYDSLWRLPRGAAAGEHVAGGGGGGGDGGGGEGEEFEGVDICRDATLVNLLEAAASSPTSCWAAKLDFLRSACWGPVVAGQVASGERGTLWGIWEEAAQRPDFLARLKHLRAAGVRLDVGEGAAQAAAWGGHADALAWLWDEAGVPMDVSDRFIMGMFGAGACAAHVPVLEMLRQRGVRMTTGTLMNVVWVLQHLSGRGDGPQPFPSPRLKGLEGLQAAEAVLGWIGDVAEEGRRLPLAEQQSWLRLLALVFYVAAAMGAGLPLLRALRAHGAAVNLGAVADSGSEETLEWAAAELGAATAARLSSKQAQAVVEAGNTAALAWLHGRGLLPPASDYLPALLRADMDMVPSRFWRLQVRAQLEADEERTDSAERSVWASFLARARAAAADDAVMVAAEAAAAQAGGPQGPAEAPAHNVLQPHQLAWLQRKADSCPPPAVLSRRAGTSA
ncbi:hypothetical protein HXX76_013159 [Chlamydomonas incerta]|uniref:Uncharacterized protein n=1 Tax=Chlamydomonas incerta TaxID=51695 RepID=A0A835VUD1_CHLIN|nr:hypothetical protein HXX76_013159 [Chlamydomonas incerta]|eukprot:KAG2426178.1 hypothetical protein HXX76_013159 [Chlamydomonas incerta]